MAHPDQLVVLAIHQGGNQLLSDFSYPDFLDYRNRAEGFSDLAGYNFNLAGISINGKAQRVVLSYVTGNYFSLLGIKPECGRLIYPTEGQSPGADPVVVLGYSFWKREFNSDTTMIGRSLLLNGHPVTVVGVGARDFHGMYSLAETEVYAPLSLAALDITSMSGFWTQRDKRLVRVFGRLKPGVVPYRIRASLNGVAAQLALQYPDTNKDIKVHVYPEWQARPEPNAADSMPTVAMLFMLLAGLVLVVACANVINILLARATAKEREMAVRAALGASRGRLMCLLLGKSMTLSGVAGLLGIGIGLLISQALSVLRLPIDIPLHLDFSFDWRVFIYCSAIAILTGTIVSVVPAVRASRGDLTSLLHAGNAHTSAGIRHHRFRNALIVCQIAGSLILLLVAGLLVHSLANAQHVSLGFGADHVINFSMDPQEVGYNQVAGNTFYRELKTRTEALHGVQSVSLALCVPFGYYVRASRIYVEGTAVQLQQHPPQIMNNVVDPDYFATMQIPVLRGRSFVEADNESVPQVAIVNQSFAARFWHNQDPIGKRFRTDSASGPFVQIVGVAKDSKYLTPADDARPYFYLPLSQHYFSLRTLQVRAAAPPDTIIPEVREQIRHLEPDLPVFDVRTMNEALNGANGFFLFRLGATLAASLGFLGMVLAMVGVYSVVSYSAVQRTREIGIRLALGAQPADITRMVLRLGTLLLGFGLAGGLALGLLVTRGMSHILLGIGVTDPVTFTAVCLLLIAVVLPACYIPARHAAKADPLSALRCE